MPKDLLKQYKALVALRDRVLDGLALHSQDTLKRSSKEDSGDLSSYGQHMADAGTDTFDRDFALSLLSSEQDALFEIEERFNESSMEPMEFVKLQEFHLKRKTQGSSIYTLFS